MTSPWIPVAPLDRDSYQALRRRAIFECCKWDAQVQDVSTIADRPLVLSPETWSVLAGEAEALAAELMAAEAELLRRPDLQRELGIPYPIRRALRNAVRAPADRDVRLVRFDFHYTGQGWRISEANCDVPGGFNEASGLAPLFQEAFPELVPVGDPAGALARAIAARCPAGGAVGLVHATAFSDDRQVMEYLGARLEGLGLRTFPTGPDHVAWSDGRARIRCEGRDEGLDFLLRFFPAEWMVGLRKSTGWRHFFSGGLTPACNPGSSLLGQSKRFPVVWDRLETPLATWRRLLPETRDPGMAPWRTDPDWIVKPAWGRVGQGIGMQGHTSAADWKRIRKDVFWNRRDWVAQRRFHCPGLEEGVPSVPCLGIYTVDGRAAGAYGRLATRAVVDHLSRDTAVFTTRQPGSARAAA